MPSELVLCHIKCMGGTPSPHRFPTMKAFTLYLCITVAAIGTAGHLARGMAESLEQSATERAELIQSIRR